MAQKKSVSVKSVTKAPLKNKSVKNKEATDKVASKNASSLSRAKIASVAARRGNTATVAKAQANRGVKTVAAAVAKPMSKQSKPIDEVEVVAKSAPKQSSNGRHTFKAKEYIVYPAHGVGQIIDVEEQEIAGLSLELFVITFEKDKMTLRVPTNKFEGVGMRKLSEPKVVEKAMTILKGRARIKRTMWSRRAQEYEAKINSGDLISISEVVRDLYRSETQPEQSYSERQLYEQALDRMAREIAVVENLDERGAIQRITHVLSKSAKGRQAAEESAANNEIGSDVEAA